MNSPEVDNFRLRFSLAKQGLVKYGLAIFALALVAGVFGLVSDSSSVVAQPARQDGAQFDPLNFDATQTITDINQLRAIARAQGSVRIIVGVQASNLRGLADAALTQSVQAAQNNLLATLRGQSGIFTVNRQFAYIPYIAMTVDAATLAALQASPLVTYIGLDAISLPILNNTTTVIGANGAGGAWEMGYEGSGQAVAVLDTGVDKSHSALSGQVVSEACYGSSETTAGYVAQPWCPGGAQSSTATGSGVNCDLDYIGCDHGTHVAGIVASTDATNKGVAPQADIIAIQVFSQFDGAVCVSYYGVSTCTLSFTSDQIDALNRVYALRMTYDIAAVNMSLGGGKYTSQAACDADNAAQKAVIDLLRGVDIATVISSGNSGYSDGMGAPGCISSAISVGATSDADAVASFSNSVSFLDLLAPGVSVMSSVPGNTYESFDGTSMAAPHVAGAWALVKNAVNDATVSEVETAFKTTGVSVLDGRNGLTFPRIQVNDAIDSLLPDATEVPTLEPTDAPTEEPTEAPTEEPTEAPTEEPTDAPTEEPTEAPTEEPTDAPTEEPTEAPTQESTEAPTLESTGAPTLEGTEAPTLEGTEAPTLEGTEAPTLEGTEAPTATEPAGTELVENGGFEAQTAEEKPDLTPWTLKNQTGDKVKCNNESKTFSHTGDCAFVFKGGTGELSTLQQVPDLTGLTPAAGDTLDFSVFVKATNAAAAGKIKVVVKYADETSSKLNLDISTAADYTEIADSITLTSGDISKVKVQIKHRSTAGKVYIDDVNLTHVVADVRGGVIPLP